MNSSSIIKKHYTVPDECLEISSNIIKKHELGLCEEYYQQVGKLEDQFKVHQQERLDAYQLVLDNKIESMETQFSTRIAKTVDDLIANNNSIYSSIENVCADVCKGVLTRIGAEMSSQEKVNILITEALSTMGAIEKCKVSLPAGCSLPQNIVGNTELWDVEEDATLPDGEMVISVGFGKIRGNFDVSFQNHIAEIG